MRLLPRGFARVLVLGALAQSVACGASFDIVAEGDSQWDRCNNLDHDVQSSNDDRLGCWRSWDQTYSGGQRPERIRQARARIGELSRPAPPSSGGARRDPMPPPGPQPPAPPAGPMDGSQDPNAPPQPPPGWGPRPADNGPNVRGPATSANGPPMSATPQVSPPNGPQPPGSACETGCRDAWNTCAAGCNGDAACSARCDDAYRDCMRGCF